MFSRELHEKKNELLRSDVRAVNVTPQLAGTKQGMTQVAEPLGSERPSALPATPKAAPEAPAGSKLTVGPRIKLRGVEITDCDTLVVEGRVEAAMDSRVVQIAEHGVFTGTATMDVAEIWGRFEGELTARKRLIIHATGQVVGIVRYGTICIEAGGALSGDVSMLARADSEGSQTASPAVPAISLVPLPLGTRHA